MKINFIEDSINWKISRQKRVAGFVYLSTMIMIVLGAVWLTISILTKMYLLGLMILGVEIMGFYVLALIRSKKLKAANYLIICCGGLYFTTVCMITTGSLIDNFTTHFYFIALALISYFLLIDEKPWIREGISLLFMALTFLFHFRLIPTVKLISLPVETHYIVSYIDLICALIIIYLITRLFVLEITKAESVLISYSDKLDGLIENILPKSIADRLKKDGKTFADYYPDCSVLFADIVDFTSWSETKSPSEVVDRLNAVFTQFDTAVERLGLTKIKTIGDSYMVAAGIPEYKKDHAQLLVTFAEEIHIIASGYPELRFRIGINSGPVVAGIIGKKRIIYDLWGDTVNVASRLEFHSQPGTTMISESVMKKCEGQIIIKNKHIVPVKGKGDLVVYQV